MKKYAKGRAVGPKVKTLAVLAFALASGHAAAFSIDTGNPDIDMRWDNTVRYNIGLRAQRANADLADPGSIQAGSDSKFRNTGEIITNRVDLMSEFDMVYKKDYGFRISGTGWYDSAYSDTNDGLGVPYSNYTRRWNKGPSADLLDAFVFGKIDAGHIPINVKVGQHNIFWGESLFTLSDSIAYAQGPVDLRKALANPGTEAKELFLPTPQISAVSQVTPDLTLGTYMMLDWSPSRLPDGGTYFGSMDTFSLGGSSVFSSKRVQPHNIGDWGVMTRYSPDWLDGTAGLYFRRLSERLPWAMFNMGSGGAPLSFNYAGNVNLYGISFAKQVAGMSLATEISYRQNTALISNAALSAEGARGDTFHALVNGMAYFGKNPLWDSASLMAELTYQHWIRATSNADLFNSCSVAGSNKWNGCATKNAVGINLALEPVWYQVVPGVDLKAPINFGMGLSGNEATLGGGHQGNGTYSLGLTAEVRNQYIFKLAYNGYLGHYNTTNGLYVGSDNTGGAVYSDRNWVSLTFTSTF
ncbi:DUF1302 domain-containing protein [Paraburkholderia sp. BR14374]|uniref:DUF1302 domain-containing protein n=1 Tax=Paraburkholderia sp. BR14374 TaxID=3237007 RepID=UPI0034CDB773